MPPEDSSPAPDVTPVADYSSPNDLDFEMTPEQEKAYVDQVLGDGVTEVQIPETPVEPETLAPVVPEPVAPVEPPAEPVAPEPVAPAEPTTPEEPKKDDLFVEVEKVVTDDLGEETTEKVKLIYDPEHPENFIPDDFKAKSDKQLAQILEAKGEMAQLYKDRRAEFDGKVKEIEDAKTLETSQKEQLASWDAEIADLISIGSIPEPKLKEGDENFLEDPSIKLTDAVFQFMTKENAERQTEGKPVIRSFGTAFAMYQKEAADKAAADKKVKDNADAKAKGALVGGGSAASVGTEKKEYVAGSAKNIWQVSVE